MSRASSLASRHVTWAFLAGVGSLAMTRLLASPGGFSQFVVWLSALFLFVVLLTFLLSKVLSQFLPSDLKGKTWKDIARSELQDAGFVAQLSVRIDSLALLSCMFGLGWLAGAMLFFFVR